jgi:hypothetical protein
MELENIIFSEVSQVQKDKGHMSYTQYYHIYIYIEHVSKWDCYRRLKEKKKNKRMIGTE